MDRDECPVKEECPEGMVYKECGTACPTTCDNKDELTICTFQCVAGETKVSSYAINVASSCKPCLCRLLL